MNRSLYHFFIAALMLPFLAFSSQKNGQHQHEFNTIGIYFGGFGGWLFPYDATVMQLGTAFFIQEQGGPLAVTATGKAPGQTRGVGGLHIGYEWRERITSNFRLASAFELEGSYSTNIFQKADVVNPTERLYAHEFIDKFPMRVGSLLANGILELNNDYLSPYVGLGVGVGFISVHDADSLQIDPLEENFNHFNSNPDDFKSVFATQVKAGLRYRFLKSYRLSAEYRFFYLTSADFTLGSTNYPTHVATTPWTIKFNSIMYNAFTLGLDFLF